MFPVKVIPKFPPLDQMMVCDKKLQPGDLIEIFRGVINHWAVYVGDDFVVHLTTPNGSSATISSSSGSSSGAMSITKALVKYEKLKAVVGDFNWGINNSMDRERQPRDAETIVEEALQLVGSEPLYNLLLNNCEHFAKELRYGISQSKQAVIGAIHLVLIPVALAAAGVPGLVMLGLGWLVWVGFGKKKVKDKDKLMSKLKDHGYEYQTRRQT
ncbi:phospholipase A and acyltransferase 3-like [Gadus macrocephalus]|uniref:phospholipase A and acyltransferase 3-like n=1 Tax=Gadus macrocephalus TaxID=80720 RepID=UPI0028CB8ADC|nr:phospholipase A and acyltransferase 3-like [Gadus macrocephalus]